MAPGSSNRASVTEISGGIRLRLKVQPKARREGIAGWIPDADGSDSIGWALKLSVGAPPENGKANAAVIALLAEALGVAKSAISVVSGATDRRVVDDSRVLDHTKLTERVAGAAPHTLAKTAGFVGQRSAFGSFYKFAGSPFKAGD